MIYKVTIKFANRYDVQTFSSSYLANNMAKTIADLYDGECWTDAEGQHIVDCAHLELVEV